MLTNRGVLIGYSNDMLMRTSLLAYLAWCWRHLRAFLCIFMWMKIFIFRTDLVRKGFLFFCMEENPFKKKSLCTCRSAKINDSCATVILLVLKCVSVIWTDMSPIMCLQGVQLTTCVQISLPPTGLTAKGLPHKNIMSVCLQISFAWEKQTKWCTN